MIATQNPRHQVGTYPLPESQLDRFLMRIDMGYPDRVAERELLKGRDRRELLTELQPVLDPARLVALQRKVSDVHAADALLDYIQDLIAASRRSPRFTHGLSPRAGLALLSAARAWAFLAAVTWCCRKTCRPWRRVSWRIVCRPLRDATSSGVLVAELIQSVPIP